MTNIKFILTNYKNLINIRFIIIYSQTSNLKPKTSSTNVNIN